MNLNDLTPRQFEVLSLVKRGLSNEAIALKLKRSIKTINITLHNAYTRLGIVMERKRTRRTLVQLESAKRKVRRKTSNTSKSNSRRSKKAA